MQGVQGALRSARTPYRCAWVNACEPEKKRRCGIPSTSYANSTRMALSQLRYLSAIPIGKSHRKSPRFILVLRIAMPCQLSSVTSNSLGLANCIGRAAHDIAALYPSRCLAQQPPGDGSFLLVCTFYGESNQGGSAWNRQLPCQLPPDFPLASILTSRFCQILHDHPLRHGHSHGHVQKSVLLLRRRSSARQTL